MDPVKESGYSLDVEVRIPKEERYKPVFTVKLEVVIEFVVKVENVGEKIFCSTIDDTEV